MAAAKIVIIKEIKKAIKKAFGCLPDQKFDLAYPPDILMGDFSFECFSLAKVFGQDPARIAGKIADKIPENKIISKAQAVGPYVNLILDNNFLFSSACFADFAAARKGKKIMVEYISPNTNKPLHLGHMRNGCLGMAISNLLEFSGNEVVKANLINDRGVHISKSMLGWQKWARGATPKSAGIKGDHFAGKWYVRFAKEAKKNPDLEKQAQDLLKKWEDGDKETRALWKMMNDWVYNGFSQTYKKLGLEFDVFYYESETYKLGKNIIALGLKRGIFYKDENGAIVFNLPENEFGLDNKGKQKKIVVQRADGTSVYMTQDLGTAVYKASKHRLDSSIYIVGSEQKYHFRCLFTILKALGYPWAKKLRHISYEMVYLPEGKMKSREGKVVDADNLIHDMIELAFKEVCLRHPEIKDSEARKRARKIGLGAIKFYLLKAGPANIIRFDPRESISFDGATGPYCQYAYSRALSILKKAGKKINLKSAGLSLLGENKEERFLAKQLIQFSEKIRASSEEFNPSLLAGQIYEIAKAFNQFYHEHSVLSAPSSALIKARLALVKRTAESLNLGFKLLNIEALKEM